MKVVHYPANHIKLTSIAREFTFQRKIERIFEEFISSSSILTEADEETAELSDEEKKAMNSLMATFVSQIKADASEVKADASDEKEQEKLKKEFPAIAKLEDEIKEGSLNEFVVTATFLAGLLAALPKLIELLGQLIKGIGSFISNKLGFKKSGDAMQKFAEKLMHAGHELHDYYIGAIKTALSFMIPDWKTLPAESQKKIAELVYLVIVLSLGVISGVGAFDSLQHAHFVHAGVEGALAAVKAGEVGAFLTNAIANTIA
jgi:gas vesicle protein